MASLSACGRPSIWVVNRLFTKITFLPVFAVPIICGVVDGLHRLGFVVVGFVSDLFVVARGDLDRVTGIADINEFDTLDHPAVVHVQAGDDSLG